ncbi:MAG TPA: efflux RND transporter periplasmic adaptor subunit [Gemmatimonadales bacterium]|nr:efflux RND transporter periplasmic adaptor subunit [Gemmatimonadales bacterium]
MHATLRHLITLALLTTITSCARKRGGDDDESGGAPPAGATTAVAVSLAPARLDSISDVLELVGRLDPTPGSSAILAAPTAAVVHQVFVQVGTEVQARQALIELDAPDLSARAHADSVAAVVATREAERQRSLLAEGIASAKQADEAANAATAARAAADANAKLLARMTVRSPIEGAVNEVRIQPGERVDAGAPLAVVMDADTLDLVVPVPAARLGSLRAGQPAWITAEGDTSRHRAEVIAVAPGVDSVTNAGRIVVRMPNPGERVHVGTGATARVVLGVIHNALVVPATALVLIGDRQAVFVVGRDSIAHARIVTVAVRSGERTAVVGPVKAGEQVVMRGGAGLADGMRVAPAAEHP